MIIVLDIHGFFNILDHAISVQHILIDSRRHRDLLCIIHHANANVIIIRFANRLRVLHDNVIVFSVW